MCLWPAGLPAGLPAWPASHLACHPASSPACYPAGPMCLWESCGEASCGEAPVSRSYQRYVHTYVSYGSPPVKVVPFFLAPLCPFPPPPGFPIHWWCLMYIGCVTTELQLSHRHTPLCHGARSRHVVGACACAVALVTTFPQLPQMACCMVGVVGAAGQTAPAQRPAGLPAGFRACRAFPACHPAGPKRAASQVSGSPCRFAGTTGSAVAGLCVSACGPKRAASPRSQAPPATSRVPQVPRLQACAYLRVVREGAVGPLCPHMAQGCYGQGRTNARERLEEEEADDLEDAVRTAVELAGAPSVASCRGEGGDPGDGQGGSGSGWLHVALEGPNAHHGPRPLAAEPAATVVEPPPIALRRSGFTITVPPTPDARGCCCCSTSHCQLQQLQRTCILLIFPSYDLFILVTSAGRARGAWGVQLVGCDPGCPCGVRLPLDSAGDPLQATSRSRCPSTSRCGARPATTLASPWHGHRVVADLPCGPS